MNEEHQMPMTPRNVIDGYPLIEPGHSPNYTCVCVPTPHWVYVITNGAMTPQPFIRWEHHSLISTVYLDGTQ